MGAGNPREECAAQFAALKQCKQRLGLRSNECYPREYNGECDQLEMELKRCVAFVVDPANAKVFYDKTRPRKVGLFEVLELICVC